MKITTNHTTDTNNNPNFDKNLDRYKEAIALAESIVGKTNNDEDMEDEYTWKRSHDCGPDF